MSSFPPNAPLPLYIFVFKRSMYWGFLNVMMKLYISVLSLKDLYIETLSV